MLVSLSLFLNILLILNVFSLGFSWGSRICSDIRLFGFICGVRYVEFLIDVGLVIVMWLFLGMRGLGDVCIFALFSILCSIIRLHSMFSTNFTVITSCICQEHLYKLLLAICAQIFQSTKINHSCQDFLQVAHLHLTFPLRQSWLSWIWEALNDLLPFFD